MDTKKKIKLSELINWVKQEIIAAGRLEDEPGPLFAIDEVTLEVKFLVSGEIGADYNLVVVQADGSVKEERVQKATIHMKALIPPEELAEELRKGHPKAYRKIFLESAAVLLKGVQSDQSVTDVPRYE